MSPAITVAIAATYDETRLLAPRGPREVLRARLASPRFAHRWTMPLLLESLALGWQQPLRVVLCAEWEALSSALQLTDELGLERSTLFYELELLEPVGGPGDREGWGGFDVLRRWCRGQRP
ncbi:MAG: hypothetical protein E6J45_12310 [Chloroflexi bacterium]|nr:MAG: hypothetical protein E6J45_12310 [Chloroflexota bacterium]